MKNTSNLLKFSKKFFSQLLYHFLRLFFVIAILTCVYLVLFDKEFLIDDKININQVNFFIIFTLANIFPISAIAYVLFQGNSQRRKLARSFWLLGIQVQGDLDQEDLDKIEANFYQRNLNMSNTNLQNQTNLSWDLEAYTEYFNISRTNYKIALNYIAQCVPTILVTLLGISLFTFPNIAISNFKLNFATIKAMQFGFLGAYIFSIQLVYRRYTSFDLRPYVYMGCTLTMISGIVFNLVAFQVMNALNNSGNTENISGLTSGVTGGILPILAFSLGYFPYLAIRWFNRVGYTALGVKQHRSNALSLKLIDGISQLHETRLRDEQIDNIENLASVSIDDLLINTRFSASEIIAWIDQAILYVYLEANEIENFRQGGIRSFSDFRDYWGPYFKAYYTVGNPTMKLIESFRHINEEIVISFSGLTQEQLKNKREQLINEWKNDNLQAQEIDKLTKNNTVNSNDKDLLSELKDQRQNLALQLKTTPEYLDTLYLSTKSGPNVAYVKHYWKMLENLGNVNHNKRFNDLNNG